MHSYIPKINGGKVSINPASSKAPPGSGNRVMKQRI